MEFLNFVISSLCTDEREFRLSLPGCSGRGNLSRCIAFDSLCSFFARILNNRYIAFGAFLMFALSFYGRVSAIAFDILCKNNCEKCMK